MEDHSIFTDNTTKIELIIAEMKLGRCCLNGPWTDPRRENMQRVMYLLGAFPGDLIDEVAVALYEKNQYENDQYRCRLYALGSEKNTDLSNAVVQITWIEILDFIHQRFIKYERYKTQHEQWNDVGRLLFHEAISNRDDHERSLNAILRRLIG
jgi:hypothetical protein